MLFEAVRPVLACLAAAAPLLAQSKSLPDAAWSGDVRAVRAWLDKGADVDAPDEQGRRPIAIASSRDALEAVEVLLEHKAKLEALDAHGRTALLVATMCGKHAAVKRLLAAGADPLARDSNGATAVHIAARLGEIELLELDPRFAAALGSFDAGGWLPIHHAAAFGRRAALGRCLPRGMGYDAPTRDGASALELAARFGRTDAFASLAAIEGWSSTSDASLRADLELFQAAARRASWLAVEPEFKTPDRAAPTVSPSDEEPVVSIRYLPGYPGARSSSRAVVLALWRDGALAFSTALGNGQRPARFAVIAPERVAKLVHELEALGLFARAECSLGGPDSGALELLARSGARSARWSCWSAPPSIADAPERLGYFRDWDAVAAGTWELAWQLILEALPDESWPLPGGALPGRKGSVGVDAR